LNPQSEYYETEPPNDVVFLMPFTYLMILYLSDINIGPGLRICEKRASVKLIRRIKSEVLAFQSITAGLFFSIYAMFFSFIENSINYWFQGESKVEKFLISCLYYLYRLYYVISFIAVFYTARKFFKSLKTKKKIHPSPSDLIKHDIAPNYTGHLDEQAQEC